MAIRLDRSAVKSPRDATNVRGRETEAGCPMAKLSTSSGSRNEKALDSAFEREMRFEAHEKRFGDTAKMRARLGLDVGEIPDRAWEMGHDAGGSKVKPGKHRESTSRSGRKNRVTGR